jgi:hypothetical protein
MSRANPQSPIIRLDFVIAGVSKSGTSFLHECLMANPAISMPAREVIAFHPRYHGRSIVQELAGELNQSLTTGIKRSNYLHDHGAMLLLHRFSCGRVVVMIRDPVVRAVSHFFHLRRYAQVSFVAVEQMVEALVSGDITQLNGVAFEIETESRYSEAVAHARRLFGEGNVLLVSFEDLKSNPIDVCGRVCDFLGVKPAPLPQFSEIPQQVIYAENWQRLWAASCRLEGICNDEGIVVAYRERPLPPRLQRTIDDLRTAARAYYNDAKPLFSLTQLDQMRDYFSSEYLFLEREGMDMVELQSLRALAI